MVKDEEKMDEIKELFSPKKPKKERVRFERKSVLGDELLSTEKIDIEKDEEEIMIPIDAITYPSPYQMRRQITENETKEMAKNLDSIGQINAITVKSDPDYIGRYILITGERRLRGALEANWATIRAFVKSKNITEKEAMAIALSENIVRKSITEIEQYMHVSKMINKYKMSQKEVAKDLSLSKTRISSLFSIRQLPKKVTESLLPLSHVTDYHVRALKILFKHDRRKMEDLLQEIIEDKIDGVAAYRKAQEITKKAKERKSPINTYVEDIIKAIDKIENYSKKANDEQKELITKQIEIIINELESLKESQNNQ